MSKKRREREKERDSKNVEIGRELRFLYFFYLIGKLNTGAIFSISVITREKHNEEFGAVQIFKHFCFLILNFGFLNVLL